MAFLGTAGYGLSRPGDIGAAPAIAWFPLAPGEAVDAEADADGQYKNRRFATAVPRPIFAGGLPVAAALVDDVPEQRFVDAPIILGGLGIPPLGPVIAVSKKAPPAVGISPPAPVAIAAAPPPPVAPEPASAGATPRQPYIVTLRDAPVRTAVHDAKKRLRVATVIVLRPRPLASALHSPHNRQHLAAARGGA